MFLLFCALVSHNIYHACWCVYSARRCDGTWGLAILHKEDPGNVVVACNGSPMVIGLGQGEIYVASETAAFNRYTKNFIAMKVAVKRIELYIRMHKYTIQLHYSIYSKCAAIGYWL